ncbi:putative src homology 3 domain containing protein [Lyophyllum shimeji]|uniref:Src homology 3 domain containing protein n=1 Tax=Lyophyllum shimeji TaxID=47721 RepID=A0A9P3PCB4_LYOSH|nr:putative src homology 3 domain containing protein [Lyophyllum shimeji]
MRTSVYEGRVVVRSRSRHKTAASVSLRSSGFRRRIDDLPIACAVRDDLECCDSRTPREYFMASVVYTESQTCLASPVFTESQPRPERRPLSICLDVAPSSSPFPSPSSSFLPPPMPGAHEFAVKPAPAGRNGRKGSLVPKEDDPRSLLTHPDATSPKSPDRLHANGTTLQDRDSILSPTTPTPRDVNATLPTPAPLSPPQATTPTPAPHPQSPSHAMTTSFSNSNSNSPSTAQPPSQTPTTPSSPFASSSPAPLDTAPTPNRPAPPSPDVSRRVSAISTASSTRSTKSSRSHPPSTPVSRTNSTRRSTSNHLSSLSQAQAQPPQQLMTPTKSSASAHASPLPSPHKSSFTLTSTSTTAQKLAEAMVPRTLVHVRDYAFPREDERFQGLGPDVPRANRVAGLNRKLRGSVGSYESSEDGDGEEEEGEEGVDEAWDRLRGGWGGGWANGTGTAQGPSQAEMDMNFAADGDGEEEGGYEHEEEEEPLYPGLYRALYAFQPEGTAEMALEEDQIVRVVGRGGGVGWAVVVDESAETPDKHALVPESYLEPVRLDWEDGEE